jgi:hypothetical protein
MADGTVFAVLIETKAVVRDNYDVTRDKDSMKPPYTCNIVNLETGEFQYLIMNAVLLSEIERGYPDNSYVGKSFLIQRGKTITGKRYRGYKIVEIEPDATTPGGAKPVGDVMDGTTPEAAEKAKSHRKKEAA